MKPKSNVPQSGVLFEHRMEDMINTLYLTPTGETVWPRLDDLRTRMVGTVSLRARPTSGPGKGTWRKLLD